MFQESLDLVLEARAIEPRLFETQQMAVRIAAEVLKDQDLAQKLVEEAVEVNSRWERTLIKHLDEE